MSNQPEPIYLPQLGDWLMITQGNSQVYVAPLPTPEGVVNLVVVGTPPQGAVSTFVVTACENSGNQVKVSLQGLNMGVYWNAGQNEASQAYPIVLGEAPETFIITGLPPSDYTIQTSFSPPGTFIHAYDPGTQVLTYGHDSSLIQGLFSIQVVG